MKYYFAIVDKAVEGGRHHTSSIQFLIKRHRTGDGRWAYKVKVGYSESLNVLNNKPLKFINDMDWEEAIHYAFDKSLGWLRDIKLEFLTEVTF
jgi:hypothetical protein